MAKVRILSGSEPATLIEKNITANGTYNASADDADGYSSVNVSVNPILITKSITENGTYTAHSEPGAPDGYSTVTVDVPTGSADITQGISYFSHTIDNSSSDVYTAEFTGKYLVVNCEVVGQSSSAHNTSADVTSTGTLLSKDSAYTTGNGNTRDCTMCVAVADVTAGDTITFVNSSLSGHVSRIHVVIPCTDILTVDNTLFDAIVDYSRDNVIHTMGYDPALLICLHVSDDNQNMNGSITSTDKVCADKIQARKCSFNLAVTTANWSADMSTTNEGNYTSRIYSTWDISQ